MPYRLLLLAGALLGSLLDLAAQTQLPVDTLLPIGRVLGVYRPSSVPEYQGSSRPWVYVQVRFDSALNEIESCVWRFTTPDDTVRVKERRPNRTMLDANGDGYRDFYDSLLVLGSDTGWVEDTGSPRIGYWGPDLPVLDLDNDGYDDIAIGARVYWGDSLEPLRRSSEVINPDRGPQSWVAYVNRLQGIPAIATAYDKDEMQGTEFDRWRYYSGWRLNNVDVIEHRDTIRVTDKLWSAVFMSSIYEPDAPSLVRNGRWLRLDYDDWVAFDTTGVVDTAYRRNVDTLLLSGKYIAGTLMLPLSHPPTLDSTLQLSISGESVLSVRQWLTPEQIIPSETKAFYLMPQTINPTKIGYLLQWPDVTGDSIPELAVYRQPSTRPEHVDDYCLEIYDIVGTATSYAVMTDEASREADVSFFQGRIVWTSVTGGDVTVRYYEASGRLLMQSRIAAETLATEGIAPTPDVGKGIRLVELVDSTGRTRRTTMVVGE
jgi:hypothetical protein